MDDFCIFNPKWALSCEDTASQLLQILCYIHTDRNDKVDNGLDMLDDEMVKQVGVVSAICELGNQFNNGEKADLEAIETDKSRTVFGVVGEFMWFAKFRKIHGLADAVNLKKQFEDGFKLFTLVNGPLLLGDCYIKKEGLKLLSEKWWRQWITNKYEFDSSCFTSRDGMLGLLEGVRYSCVEKPFGFTKNLNDAVAGLLDDDLQDIIIINSNWIPNKNWGVIHDSSIYHASDLINYLKDLDIYLGLSTYSLTYGNWPSLKQYNDQLKRLDSVTPSGGLFERSILSPAWYLQEQLSENVFNPVGDLIDAVESYVPVMGTMKNIGDAVVTTPWNTLYSYWRRGDGEAEPDVNQENEEPITEEDSLANGQYILGLTKKGEILQTFHLQKQDGTWDNPKLVVYEVNGIMFVFLYRETAEVDYQQLSNTITDMYNTYLQELILKQIDSLKKKEEFRYIIYDDCKYFSSINILPPDEDSYKYQLQSQKELIEKSLGISDVPDKSTALKTLRIIALMEDKQLHHIAQGHSYEKLTKIGRNHWGLYKRFSPQQWVVVIKEATPSEPIDSIFDDTVHQWLEWVQARGYL